MPLSYSSSTSCGSHSASPGGSCIPPQSRSPPAGTFSLLDLMLRPFRFLCQFAEALVDSAVAILTRARKGEVPSCELMASHQTISICPICSVATEKRDSPITALLIRAPLRLHLHRRLHNSSEAALRVKTHERKLQSKDCLFVLFPVAEIVIHMQKLTASDYMLSDNFTILCSPQNVIVNPGLR